jgi:cation diffusion facilitator CzcD-associated flavoprotein CzcO
MDHEDVAVIDGGQAWLATSHELTSAGVEQSCSSEFESASRGAGDGSRSAR